MVETKEKMEELKEETVMKEDIHQDLYLLNI